MHNWTEFERVFNVRNRPKTSNFTQIASFHPSNPSLHMRHKINVSVLFYDASCSYVHKNATHKLGPGLTCFPKALGAKTLTWKIFRRGHILFFKLSGKSFPICRFLLGAYELISHETVCTDYTEIIWFHHTKHSILTTRHPDKWLCTAVRLV